MLCLVRFVLLGGRLCFKGWGACLGARASSLIIITIIIIIIIIIISLFKVDNIFSMTDHLPYGPPVNTDIEFLDFL